MRAPLMAASSPWLAAACLPAPHLSPFFLDLVSEAQPLAVEFRPQWSRRLPFSSLLVPRESENPRDGTQLPVPDASPHRGTYLLFPLESGVWIRINRGLETLGKTMWNLSQDGAIFSGSQIS